MNGPLGLVATFVLGIVAAWLRVLFTRRSTEGKAIAAANYHTLISASAAAGTIIYVQRPVAVASLLVGCWIGTFFATRSDSR